MNPDLDRRRAEIFAYMGAPCSAESCRTCANLRDELAAFEAAVRRDEIARVRDSDTAGANMGREP